MTYQDDYPQKRRPRKNDQVKRRFNLARYFEELLQAPIFDDPDDPYAQAVQEEIYDFAERRIAELFGEPTEDNPRLTQTEVIALKALAAKILAPDSEEPSPKQSEQPEPQIKRAPPIAAPSTPPEDDFEATGDLEAPPLPPLPPPRAQPRGASRVVARPTIAQKRALERQRAETYRSPPEPVEYAEPEPPQLLPKRRGKKLTQRAAPYVPPTRIPMPTGKAMEAILAQKAAIAVAEGRNSAGAADEYVNRHD